MNNNPHSLGEYLLKCLEKINRRNYTQENIMTTKMEIESLLEDPKCWKNFKRCNPYCLKYYHYLLTRTLNALIKYQKEIAQKLQVIKKSKPALELYQQIKNKP